MNFASRDLPFYLNYLYYMMHTPDNRAISYIASVLSLRRQTTVAPPISIATAAGH